MLRNLFFGLLSVILACGCVMEKSFSWDVTYDPRIAPSCLITFSDEYWDWRDSQGPSLDRAKDVQSIYKVFTQRVTELHEPFPISLCNEEILMSSGLARIMNSFGQNSTPIALYYQMVERWEADLNQEHHLNLFQFENILFASLREIESRFQES